MNTKVLTTLEYTKIIDLLTEKADSEPGKKLCRELVPSTDLWIMSAGSKPMEKKNGKTSQMTAWMPTLRDSPL